MDYEEIDAERNRLAALEVEAKIRQGQEMLEIQRDELVLRREELKARLSYAEEHDRLIVERLDRIIALFEEQNVGLQMLRPGSVLRVKELER